MCILPQFLKDGAQSWSEPFSRVSASAESAEAMISPGSLTPCISSNSASYCGPTLLSSLILELGMSQVWSIKIPTSSAHELLPNYPKIM